ncbi:hypothetical protein SAMN04488012_103313 [Palleronia salina]|uniref:Uncharacterized protein n=1 Tax=Palleronia salina TaxID=313368 RepID=A0A1M6F2D7_9RHOB|nr:hypothetical protein [Palleronia salina]SHI91878.1 hypothetical protein SAMN04488012_103313 [Palleronia salina]
MDALERAKQKIREEAERRIAELEEASALAAKYGMTLSPINEVEPVEVDPSIGRVLRHNKGWRETILEIVSEFSGGATRSQIRNRLSETHLSQRLAETDAAFYGTISKAVAKGELVEHNGHMFTPFLFRRFQDDVQAGRREDVRSERASQTGNKTVVIDFVASHPGVDADVIFAEIKRRNPGSMKNKNSVYNLLARMVRDNEIAKNGKTYVPLGYENEASAGASEANAEEGSDLFGAQDPNKSRAGK